MDLHSKTTMYITCSTMTSPVTKTAKTSKWIMLRTALPTVVALSVGPRLQGPETRVIIKI